MRTTFYDRLYDRLTDLIPDVEKARAGTAFYAAPPKPDDMAVFCQILDVQGPLRLIQIAKDKNNAAGQPVPWFTLRVDTANRLAEVLEMENEQGYSAAYARSQASPRRYRLNLLAVNWLQFMIGFELRFQSVDALVAA